MNPYDILTRALTLTLTLTLAVSRSVASYDVLREELKRIARAADTPPPC